MEVNCSFPLTNLHSERPKLYGDLTLLSATGLRTEVVSDLSLRF